MNIIAKITDELLSLVRQGENYQVEYKEARRELPKNLFDTVCSFSNRDGGDIFLGVHDSGVILGIDHESSEKLITNFITLANNREKVYPPLYLIATEYSYNSGGTFSKNR